MLTSTQTVRRYSGPFTEGQEIQFDIAFIEETDLKLSLDDVALEYNSDYTVTAIKSEGLITGATIALLKAFPEGKILVVQRDTAPTQEQDYPENGPFESIDVERGFDKLTMKTQEIEYREKRFIKISDVEGDSFNNMLPPATEKPAILTVSKEKVDLVYVDPHEIENAVEEAKAEADRATTAANEAEQSVVEAEQAAATSAANAEKAETAAATAEAAAERAEKVALPAGQSGGDFLIWDGVEEKAKWGRTIATVGTLGTVKPDGDTITIDGDGTIHGKVTDPYVLPVASEDVLGGVKVDGKTIVIDENGVISATSTGGVKVSSLTNSIVEKANVATVTPSSVHYLKQLTVRPTDASVATTRDQMRITVPKGVYPSVDGKSWVTWTGSINNSSVYFVAKSTVIASHPIWYGFGGIFYYGTVADLTEFAGDRINNYVMIGYTVTKGDVVYYDRIMGTPGWVVFDNTPAT